MPNGHQDYTPAPDYTDSIQLVRLTAVDGQIGEKGVDAFERIYTHWERYYKIKESALTKKLHELEHDKSRILVHGGIVSEEMEEKITAEKSYVDEQRKTFRSKLIELILSSDWKKTNPISLGDELVRGKHYLHACELFGMTE